MACATVRRGGRVTHSGDYCTTTTGTGVRWRAAQSFILLDERNNLAASDPIYLTRASKDKNNCNVRENSDWRWLRECLKKAIGGGGADARQQRSAMGARMRGNSDLRWGRGCAATRMGARHQRSTMGARHQRQVLEKSKRLWGRGCATTAICDGGAGSRQQRSVMGARMRDNSDLQGFGQIQSIPRPGL